MRRGKRRNPAGAGDWSWLSFVLGVSAGGLAASWYIKQAAAQPSSSTASLTLPNLTGGTTT
jgi:hypothetical protein